MKSERLSFGIFLLILGLTVYDFGLLLTLHQTSIMDYVLNLISDIKSVELIGVLMQLIGGVVTIMGFVTFVSQLFAIKIEHEMRLFKHEISSRIEEIISNLITRQKLSIAPHSSQTIKICKYCSASLSCEDVFCPICGKSQI